MQVILLRPDKKQRKMLTSAQRIAIALLLALLVSGCAQDNYAEKMAQRDREFSNAVVASAKDYAAKLQAESEAKIADDKRRIESFRPLLRDYYVCNRSASKIVSTQPGDPISLAVAARNICRSEEANLRKTAYAAYADDPQFVMTTMEKFRARVLENNTGDIVASRAAANSTQAPSRPPETTRSNKGQGI